MSFGYCDEPAPRHLLTLFHRHWSPVTKCEYLEICTLEIKILHWEFGNGSTDPKTVPFTTGKTLYRPQRLAEVASRHASVHMLYGVGAASRSIGIHGMYGT